MFGYVRPLKGELKVREYEQFGAAYCGLCHALRTGYGFTARFTLNYDLVFMAMLMSDPSTPPALEYRRCVVSPFRKRACCRDSALEESAGYCVILAYWKLMDTAADEGFIKSLIAGAGAFILRRAYRKACERLPVFDALVRDNLAALRALETEKCPSIDMTADKFALILQGAAEPTKQETRRRTLQQLLYHAGRVVYLLDAVDDLPRDISSGAYNPLIYRFALNDGGLSEEDRATVSLTVAHSQALMSSAFELLDAGPWTGILENIIHTGIPWVTRKVFAGEWEKPRRGLPGTHAE